VNRGPPAPGPPVDCSPAVTLRRLIAAALTLAFAVALGACGSKEDTVTRAEFEGLYVDVGDLSYQVQISRELNARDEEDQTYLKGLPPGTPPLKPTESWFGVFIQVRNESNQPAQAARDFRIVNTQFEENKACEPANGCYKAVQLDRSVNSFAWTSTQVDPGELFPPQSSLAQYGPTQGSMLLFRIPYGSYENRPLELAITGALPSERASVVLDL
jgi:hypothetical protein